MNDLKGYEVRRACPHLWLVARTVRSFFPAKFRGLSIDNPWGGIMKRSLRSALCGAVALLVWAAGTTPALATATCKESTDHSYVSNSDPLRVSCTLWGTASADLMTGEMLVSKTPPWAAGDAIAGLADHLVVTGFTDTATHIARLTLTLDTTFTGFPQWSVLLHDSNSFSKEAGYAGVSANPNGLMGTPVFNGNATVTASADGTHFLVSAFIPVAQNKPAFDFDVTVEGIAYAPSSVTSIGRLSLSLPDGLRLTTPVLSVPEPADWAMMLAGLVIIGATLRRRRAAPAG